jgi:histidine triad (HIT) family protein
MDDCLFYRIIRKEVLAHVVLEKAHVIVFLSLENHPLIVTKQHIRDVYELTDEIAAEVMRAAVVVSAAVKDVLTCDGINLVQSNGSATGQDVFHFHMHIKPRWRNDDAIFKWDTSTVAEEQREQSCDDLKKRLAL